MKHGWRPTVLVLAAAMTLGACQANSTDPTKGGFFGGVSGLSSGNYQRGVEERERALEDARDQQIALQREADRMDQRNAALEQELSATRAEADALNRELASLDSRIQQARKDEKASATELDRLQRELADLNSELQSQELTFDEQKKKAKLAELRRRKEQLEAAILSLLK